MLVNLNAVQSLFPVQIASHFMHLLVFPNQLFQRHPGLKLEPDCVVLIEDSLFFGDHRYPLRFHQQKLWLHRATMKRYEVMLRKQKFQTKYLEYDPQQNQLQHQLGRLMQGRQRPRVLAVAHPTDFILEKRLERLAADLDVPLEYLPNPGFINTPEKNAEYRSGKNRWFMADFYKWQRQRLDVMMEGDEPAGGQWSFDQENRKKVPQDLLNEIPEMPEFRYNDADRAAVQYVRERFPGHPGNLDQLYYPTTHRAARRWFKDFLNHRLARFGDYEDAIVQGQSWLWHSVLTPALNIGLLTPDYVLKATVSFANEQRIPINSLEGFVRQIIGWREFMRATYQDLGVRMRTSNHWNHHRQIPESFYDATTGIPPIDDTIRRVLNTGYCHHIERLMVLGGFMFLCEFDPDQIYNWFMEMFVDSYDWVMVPNVYAMSQHADGGLITTKPYFSGSSYIRKMSHYGTADWCEIWDGLYWRWIWNHADKLANNPRWAMMCSMVRNMDSEKRDQHLKSGNQFLKKLDG